MNNIAKPTKDRIIDRLTMIAARIGNQVHLRALRDAFAILMPFFILAGLGVLVNSVVLPWFLEGDGLLQAQDWSSRISNGTLNIAGLLIAPMTAYCLSKNKGFNNEIAAAAVAIGTLIIMMPSSLSITPVGTEEAVEATGILAFQNLGTTGMFAGIIIGLLATELFIQLSKVKRFQFNLGENVPPQVGKSFGTMIPVMLVLAFFALIGLMLRVFLGTDFLSLVSTLVQEPLRRVNTSILGMILIYSTGNLLFSMGIHQSVINGALLDPLTLANINDNMAAFAAGEEVPHIITHTFIRQFGQFGGTGATISLLIAIFLFSRDKSSRNLAKLSAGPGLFNINEPVIFGYSIVFNIPMMIPFVLFPALSLLIAYFATAVGLISKTVVMVPWTTPPLLGAYLGTAGDWRAVILQLLLIVMGVFIYLPFMRISERAAKLIAEDNVPE